ncbi:hypothetical protein PpBr36_07764 [Pyricularia pennisetigena]|uniref:hypothetical protein n=1 Tax=Pyricularia pennisetigena TaxID=1578925 RepID=UPI00114EA1EE|nr:hypothetical protein PpBr36_07764 [Pyricularia pennisetigena]TLS25949.1 hypothetical protein PpBr36_07764 [Pyricularia pennisetigena]
MARLASGVAPLYSFSKKWFTSCGSSSSSPSFSQSLGPLLELVGYGGGLFWSTQSGIGSGFGGGFGVLATVNFLSVASDGNLASQISLVHIALLRGDRLFLLRLLHRAIVEAIVVDLGQYRILLTRRSSTAQPHCPQQAGVSVGVSPQPEERHTSPILGLEHLLEPLRMLPRSSNVVRMLGVNEGTLKLGFFRVCLRAGEKPDRGHGDGDRLCQMWDRVGIIALLAEGYALVGVDELHSTGQIRPLSAAICTQMLAKVEQAISGFRIRDDIQSRSNLVTYGFCR